MSDEMPSDWNGRRVDLRQCLLNPILADIAKACLPSRLNGVGAMGLGHRDDRNGLAMTTPPRCQVDFFAHFP
jgi:hypothetical protein